MGVISKSQAKNMPSQSNKSYEIRGLIFESKTGYNSLKNINDNAKQLVKNIKEGHFTVKEYFDRFDKVKVKETYPDAAENLEELFENITQLYIYNDREYLETELDFSAYFHSKMVIDFYND